MEIIRVLGMLVGLGIALPCALVLALMVWGWLERRHGPNPDPREGSGVCPHCASLNAKWAHSPNHCHVGTTE